MASMCRSLGQPGQFMGQDGLLQQHLPPDRLARGKFILPGQGAQCGSIGAGGRGAAGQRLGSGSGGIALHQHGGFGDIDGRIAGFQSGQGGGEIKFGRDVTMSGRRYLLEPKNILRRLSPAGQAQLLDPAALQHRHCRAGAVAQHQISRGRAFALHHQTNISAGSRRRAPAHHEPCGPHRHKTAAGLQPLRRKQADHALHGAIQPHRMQQKGGVTRRGFWQYQCGAGGLRPRVKGQHRHRLEGRAIVETRRMRHGDKPFGPDHLRRLGRQRLRHIRQARDFQDPAAGMQRPWLLAQPAAGFQGE